MISLLLIAFIGIARADFKDFQKKANAFGYQVSQHLTLTQDGYKIKMVKLHADKHGLKYDPTLNPVVLAHGVGMSADSWIMHAQTVEECLPCMISNMGYDVWMTNTRGTLDYSSHKDYSFNS